MYKILAHANKTSSTLHIDRVRRGGSQEIETQTQTTLVQYQKLVLLMKNNSMEGH